MRTMSSSIAQRHRQLTQKVRTMLHHRQSDGDANPQKQMVPPLPMIISTMASNDLRKRPRTMKVPCVPKSTSSAIQ